MDCSGGLLHRCVEQHLLCCEAAPMTGKQRQWLLDLADGLDAADRISMGQPLNSLSEDKPEGSLVIQLSNTLAEEIAFKLREIALG